MVNTPTSNLARPPAFTLAELIIGLLLLVIIGGAAAGLAAAMSRGWQAGESAGSSNMTISRTLLRIQDKIQRAKALGQWRGGSLSPGGGAQGAAIFFWREDANGDGKMQLEETQILEHDPSTKRLIVWETKFPDDVTRATHDGPFATTMLSGATAIDDYKVLPHTKKYVITRGVLGAAFHLITPTTPEQRPQFEFRLKFNGPTGETVEYGTSSPRSLWTAP